MELVQEGIRLVLANPSRVVVRQIERAGLDKLIGREFIHVRMHEAVTFCKVSFLNSFFAGACTLCGIMNPLSGEGFAMSIAVEKLWFT